MSLGVARRVVAKKRLAEINANGLLGGVWAQGREPELMHSPPALSSSSMPPRGARLGLFQTLDAA